MIRFLKNLFSTQPDIIIGAGGYCLNPKKRFTRKQRLKLLPKLEALNKTLDP